MDKIKRNIITFTKDNKILFGKDAAKLQYRTKLKELLKKEDHEGAAKLRREWMNKV